MSEVTFYAKGFTLLRNRVSHKHRACSLTQKSNSVFLTSRRELAETQNAPTKVYIPVYIHLKERHPVWDHPCQLSTEMTQGKSGVWLET